MGYVHVHVENAVGGKVALLLDDEKDAERIEYLKKLGKREDFKSVRIVKPPTKKEAAKKPADPPAGDPQSGGA